MTEQEKYRIDVEQAEKAFVSLLTGSSLKEGKEAVKQFVGIPGIRDLIRAAQKADDRSTPINSPNQSYMWWIDRAEEGQLQPSQLFSAMIGLNVQYFRQTIFDSLVQWCTAAHWRVAELKRAITESMSITSSSVLFYDPYNTKSRAWLCHWLRDEDEFSIDFCRHWSEISDSERFRILYCLAGILEDCDLSKHTIVVSAVIKTIIEASLESMWGGFKSVKLVRDICEQGLYGRVGLFKEVMSSIVGRDEISRNKAALIICLALPEENLAEAIEELSLFVEYDNSTDRQAWTWLDEVVLDQLRLQYSENAEATLSALRLLREQESELAIEALLRHADALRGYDEQPEHAPFARDFALAMLGLGPCGRGLLVPQTHSHDLPAVSPAPVGLNQIQSALQRIGPGYQTPSTQLRSLHAAMQAEGGSRMAILAGPPGTGKTLLALLYAGAATGFLEAAVSRAGSGVTLKATLDALQGLDGFRRLCSVVRVRPDWTSDRDVLGYLNILSDPPTFVPGVAYDLLIHARENPEQQHFLILDELNLSHPEYYMSQLISAMESGGKILVCPSPSTQRLMQSPGADTSDGARPPATELDYPRNLRIIGTINNDETTRTLSPRLRSRAHIIDLRTHWEGLTLHGNKAQLAELLKELDNALSHAGLGLSLRDLDQLDAYVGTYCEGTDTPELRQTALDEGLCQKLLPKLRGTEEQLEEVLKAVKAVLERHHATLLPGQSKVAQEVERRIGTLKRVGFVDG